MFVAMEVLEGALIALEQEEQQELEVQTRLQQQVVLEKAAVAVEDVGVLVEVWLERMAVSVVAAAEGHQGLLLLH